MKIDEVRSKTDSELEFDMEALKKELYHLRFQSATQSIPNPSRIRELRRSVARVRTILHERKTGVRGQEPR